VDTRNTQRLSGGRAGEHNEGRGLGAWIRRNRWLLTRLFIVVVFSILPPIVAEDLAYGLQGDPTTLNVEQIRAGNVPKGTEIGDYVQIRGTPDVGKDLQKVGTPESEIAYSTRYSVAYFYFRLEETGDSLFIQTAERLPDFEESGERVWRGKLSNVGTVIFHDTTQEALARANLPRDEAIPVVETGDTPEYYRELRPVHLTVIGIWLLSVAWLVWKKNKPFLGL
jgi:hypothetical protein